MKYYWKKMGTIGLLFVLSFVGLVFAIIAGSMDAERLIKQCMADGKKEYECRAMFRDNTQHAPVYIYR